MLKTLKQHVLIILILVVATAVRLPLLSGSVWLDEAAQILESSRPLSEQLDIIPDFQPPLLHLFMHFSLYISDQVWWLRTITALIPALVTILCTYLIGKHLFNKSTGLLAAFFLSISSFHVFYSQELRPYMLPALFATTSWLILLQLIRSYTETKDPTRHVIFKPWLLFTILTIGGLYSSYLYPFLFISQILYVLLSKRLVLIPFVLSCAGGIAAFIPWIPTFMLQLNAGGQVRQELPGWEDVVSFSQLKSIPLTFAKFTFGVLPVELNAFFIASCLILGLTFLLCFWPAIKTLKQTYQKYLPLFIWLLIPLVTAWIVSFVVPVIQPKRVLFLMPAFMLLLAAMITSTKKTLRPSTIDHLPFAINHLPSLLFTLTFISISIYSLTQYWTRPMLQRENWKYMHEQIATQFSPQTTVTVFSFPGPFPSWDYYDNRTFPVFSTGTLLIDNAPNLDERLATLRRFETILVFDYLRDLTDPTNELPTDIEALGYTETSVIDSPGVGFVRVYTRQQDDNSGSLGF